MSYPRPPASALLPLLAAAFPQTFFTDSKPVRLGHHQSGIWHKFCLRRGVMTNEEAAMTIAATLKAYLEQRAVADEIVTHPPAASSLRTAEAAHLPGHRVVKAVVVGDEQGHRVVVIPAPFSVDLGRLHRPFGRRLGLATEPELAPLFPDGEPGVVARAR
jgi:hypothetical protein